MMNQLSAEKRLTDLEMNTIESDYINKGRIDILYWFIETKPSEEQVSNKIQRIKEEMIPLNSNSAQYYEKDARIKELTNILKN